jgi:hypothetical protein
MSPAMNKAIKDLKENLSIMTRAMRDEEWSVSAEQALILEQELFKLRLVLEKKAMDP